MSGPRRGKAARGATFQDSTAISDNVIQSIHQVNIHFNEEEFNQITKNWDQSIGLAPYLRSIILEGTK